MSNLLYDKENDRFVKETIDGNYWHDQRFEYSSGNLIYKGTHTTHKEATSSTTWYVWKYTWTGDDLTRIEGPLVGSWDNRASLSWA